MLPTGCDPGRRGSPFVLRLSPGGVYKKVPTLKCVKCDLSARVCACVCVGDSGATRGGISTSAQVLASKGAESKSVVAPDRRARTCQQKQQYNSVKVLILLAKILIKEQNR